MKKLCFLFIFVSLCGLFFLNQYHSRLSFEDLQRSYLPHVSDQPGIQIEIFDQLGGKGYPIFSHVVSTLDLLSSSFAPLNHAPISATVKGFLKVPKSAVYSLELASDDGALLYLDGKRVVNNWGFHTYEAKKRKIYLKKGWHYLMIRYQNRTGASGLKLAWAPRGEKRRPVGVGDLFLEKNLLRGANPFTGVLAKELLFLNQLRAFFVLTLALGLVFLFWGKKISPLFYTSEFWLAVALFVLALGLRLVHYFNHLYLRIQGIMDGGDNHYFVMLPIQFVTSHEFVTFKCGNQGLLVPLVGLFYKYFHFFPGLHYASLFMIFLGALLCLFPWLLLRCSSFAWVGLVAGIFLAVNPLLVAFQIPYVSSDPLGLFVFGLAVTLCLKALSDNRWGSYVWAGITLGLLPIARTVYIPSAPLFALALILLGKKRGRALLGFVAFAAVMGGYELLARIIVKQPYYLYFLHDGYSATVVHRATDQPQSWFEMVLWLPRFLWSYGKLMLENLLPPVWNFFFLKWGIALLLCGSAVLATIKQLRLFLFLLIIAGIYLFEIASYHLNERLSFPVIFVLGMVLALGLREVMFVCHPERSEGSRLKFLAPLLLALTAWQLGQETIAAVHNHQEKKEYFSWLKQEFPPKAILLTDHQADPWELHAHTAAPVFFEATLDQTLVVNRSIVPIHQVLFLEEQSQIPKQQTPEAQFFRRHPYVLDGLARLGYRYFIFQPDFAEKLENFYFKERTEMSINETNYGLKKTKQYPKNPRQGLWEVVWKNEPLRQASSWNPPKYPKDLDRFLK